MTALRQSIIAELEKVPEDKLHVIMQFIDTLTDEAGAICYAAYRTRTGCRCLCKGAKKQ